MRFLACVVAAAVVAAGCTLGALDDLSKGATPDPGAPDAATSLPDGSSPVQDAGAPTDSATPVVDAGADADAGLRNSCGALLTGTEIPLTNPGFELGCQAGWTADIADRTNETTLVSQGAIACRVCGNTTSVDQFHINQDVMMAVQAGQVYEVVGCVRTAPGFTPATMVEGLVTTEGGSEGHQGDPVELIDSYQPVRASLTIDGNYNDVNADVNAAATAGTCFLVDDVRLFRVQ